MVNHLKKIIINCNTDNLDSLNIIHFGCWNKDCNKDSSGLNSVVNLSNSILTQKNVNKFIITGDNYYPEKSKEYFQIVNGIKTKVTKEKYKELEDQGNDKIIKESNKIFVRKNLLDGFLTCLNGINFFPKDIILGNHDVLDDPKYGNGEECNVFDTQLKNLKNDSNKIYYPFHLEEIFLKNLSIAFIYIDTSFYSIVGKKDKYIKKINRCIGNQIQTKDKKFNEVINEQNLFIKETLLKEYDIYIFVGHAPLFGLKTKDGENVDNRILPLLDLFNSPSNKGKNILYICADIHLFQYGTISNDNFKILQIISGTGGADLDEMATNADINIEGIRYKIIHQDKNYGISTLKIDNNNITTNFHSIINTNFNHKYNLSNFQSVGGYKINYT